MAENPRGVMPTSKSWKYILGGIHHYSLHYNREVRKYSIIDREPNKPLPHLDSDSRINPVSSTGRGTEWQISDFLFSDTLWQLMMLFSSFAGGVAHHAKFLIFHDWLLFYRLGHADSGKVFFGY